MICYLQEREYLFLHQLRVCKGHQCLKSSQDNQGVSRENEVVSWDNRGRDNKGVSWDNKVTSRENKVLNWDNEGLSQDNKVLSRDSKVTSR